MHAELRLGRTTGHVPCYRSRYSVSRLLTSLYRRSSACIWIRIPYATTLVCREQERVWRMGRTAAYSAMVQRFLILCMFRTEQCGSHLLPSIFSGNSQL